MKIISATPGDAPVLARLNRFVHDPHAEHRPDIYRANPPLEELAPGFAEQLGRESVRAFIAELPGDQIDRPDQTGGEDHAVGYAMANIVRRAENPLMHAESIIFLEHLAVDPAAVRRGVATALLEAVAAAGREAGCRRLVTDVWDFNEEARAFYRTAGFAPMRRLLDRPL
ncbi:GNAT family N-acetyltransferase [Planobispora rosea]|nr:GNAT family N-acetyltransferase [Planobispora rosea]